MNKKSIAAVQREFVDNEEQIFLCTVMEDFELEPDGYITWTDFVKELMAVINNEENTHVLYLNSVTRKHFRINKLHSYGNITCTRLLRLRILSYFTNSSESVETLMKQLKIDLKKAYENYTEDVDIDPYAPQPRCGNGSTRRLRTGR